MKENALEMELKLNSENNSNDCFLSAYCVVRMYRDHHWKGHNEYTDISFPQGIYILSVEPVSKQRNKYMIGIILKRVDCHKGSKTG